MKYVKVCFERKIIYILNEYPGVTGLMMFRSEEHDWGDTYINFYGSFLYSKKLSSYLLDNGFQPTKIDFDDRLKTLIYESPNRIIDFIRNDPNVTATNDLFTVDDCYNIIKITRNFLMFPKVVEDRTASVLKVVDIFDWLSVIDEEKKYFSFPRNEFTVIEEA